MTTLDNPATGMATGYNILVQAQGGVWVRYNYSPVSDDEAAEMGRPVSGGVVPVEVWDDNVRNAIGRMGASVSKVRRSDIETAIARLRDAWGPIPVYSNLPAWRLLNE